jgi:uncharacterized protein (TIGR02246 family)
VTFWKYGDLFMAKSSNGFSVTVWIGFLLASAPAWAEDVRHAVEAGNRSLIAAVLRGDASAVADHYTENAQVIAPGAPISTGRAAVTEFWQSVIESGIKDVTLDTAEAESDGNIAYETGALGIVSNDGTRTTARYVVVWRRVGDKWFLHRDTWNSAE